MEYTLNALSIYEFGQRKDKEGNPHQEDWIYPAMGEMDSNRDRLFILCDGMGGHHAGEVASATVCEAMSHTINDALERGEKFSEKLLLAAIDAAYNLLDERDNDREEEKKMGTTMTFLMLHEGGATIAHMGDSRVYHIRPNTGTKSDVLFQTKDHSLVNDLLDIGELTPDEVETYPRKNVITRAMQPHLPRRYRADIYSTKDVCPGDYFYMCSDGMLEQTSNDNLCMILNEEVSDEEKREMLVKVTKKNKDNHSAHIIHILDVKRSPEEEEEMNVHNAPDVKEEMTECSAPSVEEEEDEFLVKPEFEEKGEESTTSSLPVPVQESAPATPSLECPKDWVGSEGKRGTLLVGKVKRMKWLYGILLGVLFVVLLILGLLLLKSCREQKEKQDFAPQRPGQPIQCIAVFSDNQ